MQRSPRSLRTLFVCLSIVILSTAGVSAAPATSPAGPSPYAAPAATAKPHPILGDLRVRQAIAYCTDKMGLASSVYGHLTPEQRQSLIADTIIRPTSWAYSTPDTVYPYAPAAGRALLEDAGWTLAPGATYRTRGGRELAIVLRTTTAGFRQTLLSAFEEQMKSCGVHVIREHLDAAWFFGIDGPTGLRVRDFELADYAWVIPDEDPGGLGLWSCNYIPTPANDWQGPNYTGWCNGAATAAIVTATDTTKPEAERKAAYGVVIDQVAAEVPVLPLFWRWDDQASAPSETWEHIDFNLETFSQEAELSPTGQTVLATSDYDGNAGSVIAPASAVPQATSLSYYPLVAPAKTAPEGDSGAAPFRLMAAVAGVLQPSLQPFAPVTVTLHYQDAGIPYLDESTLDLFWWDAAMGWREAGKTCAPSDRYRAFDVATNTLTVRTCRFGEFTLLGRTIPYWPLAVGNGWRYAWNNTQYGPASVSETVWTAGKSGTQHRMRAIGELGDTTAVFESAGGGVEMAGYTMQPKVSNPFPTWMYTLLSYLIVPSQILPDRWKVGQVFSQGAYFDDVYYTTTTTMVSNDATVTAGGQSYPRCLQIETTIDAEAVDYVTGTRTLWFARDVGLVKMVYQHGDGSVTTAELVETMAMPVVRLPLVQGK